jgi:hypothetical protein
MNYFVKYYIKLFLSYSKKRYHESSYKSKKSKINNIAIIYSIPKSSPRLNTWNDGFVDAVRLLGKEYNITWINIDIDKVSENLLNSFDFLLVKSNWNWGPDKILRDKFRDLKVKKGLAISGVSIPPSFNEMLYYDILWYETNWYKRIIQNHPNIYHGFGINKNQLVPKANIPIYDYISIGAFLPHKRMHILTKLKGRILIIGEKYNTQESEHIYKLLKQKDNIEIKPFVSYDLLGDYFCTAKTLYIPAAINGGGERAILEARHCGLDIKVESDNPKLKEIVNSPIWDSEYYFTQLSKGINSLKC